MIAAQIVKEPMDLKTMRHKAQTGQYRTLQEMRDDCELMSKNALLFNRAPGEVSACRQEQRGWSFRAESEELGVWVGKCVVLRPDDCCG